jgi:hypothetical protein
MDDKEFDSFNAGPSPYARPWQFCCSTHCERSEECRSPHDCMVRKERPGAELAKPTSDRMSVGETDAEREAHYGGMEWTDEQRAMMRERSAMVHRLAEVDKTRRLKTTDQSKPD